MVNSTHTYSPDERNSSILININGELIPREKATVSVFDSGFILGDGIWEGLRVHEGTIPFLSQHLKRLWEGAKALDLDMGISRDALADRLFKTLTANNMRDHVHIRLMVTRGIKSTPYQDLRSQLVALPLSLFLNTKRRTQASMIVGCGSTRFIRAGVTPTYRTLESIAIQNSTVFLDAFKPQRRATTKH